MGMEAAKYFLGNLRENPRQAVALQGISTARLVREAAAQGFVFGEGDLRAAFRKTADDLAKSDRRG